MNRSHTLALFNNFEEAARAIRDLKSAKLEGMRMEDVTLKSPIEHPEVAEELGERPVYVQIFTAVGALSGAIFGFLFIASSQASFLLQYRGGRPIVPIPSNMVLTYELFILCGVLMTVIGCFIAWKLPGKRSPLYNVDISEDKIGILVRAEDRAIPGITEIFKRHMALDITVLKGVWPSKSQEASQQ